MGPPAKGYRPHLNCGSNTNHRILRVRARFERVKIKGLELERWFLETLINIEFGGEHRSGSDSTIAGAPSFELTRARAAIKSDLRRPRSSALRTFAGQSSLSLFRGNWHSGDLNNRKHPGSHNCPYYRRDNE